MAGRFRRTAAAVTVAFAALTASGCYVSETTEPDRAEVIRLVNRTRASGGLPALQRHPVLDEKADRWAKTLRDSCNLFHSRLADGAPENWGKLGENVGYGGTIAVVHAAYLNSPGHKENILDPMYTHMGAAAVYGECNGRTRVFTVHEFMAERPPAR